MKQGNKFLYQAPEIESLEFTGLGTICQVSPNPGVTPGNPFDGNEEDIW